MKTLVAFLASALAACTTVSNGPMQRIYVDSDPQGAAVRIESCGAMATKTVTTPAVAWVSRRSTQCQFVFRKPYYAEQKVKLSRRLSRHIHRYGDAFDELLFDGSSLGDVAVFGTFFMLPSFAVDAASGSMFELEPNQAFAHLEATSEEWRDRKAP